jgi:hypothetical protein
VGFAGLVIATFEYLIKPVLRHPDVSAAHCDQVISLLEDHRIKAIDGWAEALKEQYIVQRLLLHDLAARPANSRASVKSPRDEEIAMLMRSSPDMGDDLKKFQASIKADLNRASAQDYARAAARLARLYRDLLATTKLPFPDRYSRAEAIIAAFPRDTGPERAIVLTFPTHIGFFTNTQAQAEAWVVGIQALAAARRWQVVHKTVPNDLAEACREANLPGIPADPYTNGQPLRYAVSNGAPFVACVGPDGVDDSALAAAGQKTEHGDLVLSLSPRTQPPPK